MILANYGQILNETLRDSGTSKWTPGTRGVSIAHCYTRNVNEYEMECEDGEYPSIDTGAGIKVGVSEHTFNVAHVDFNNHISNADEVQFEHS
jgi:hypothetical protein